MLRPTRRSRALLATGLGLATLAAATVGSPAAQAAPTAPAAPLAYSASGPFEASSDSQLLTLDLPSLAGDTVPGLLPATDLVLGDSFATADSDDTPRTSAGAGSTGSNADSSTILGQDLQLDSAFADAPESEVDDPDPVIPVPASPLAELGLLDAYAEANWVSDTECVAGDTPLSLAQQSLADAVILDLGDPGTVAETGPGAVSSTADTYLVPIPGANDPRAVYASSTANVAALHLLLGNLNVDVERVGDTPVPDVTAQASGIAGGASVTFGDYIVTVTAPDGDDADSDPDELVTLDSRTDANNPTGAPIGLTLQNLIVTDLGNVLTDLGLGALAGAASGLLDPLSDTVLEALTALQPTLALSIPRTDNSGTQEFADGLVAEGSTALLRVELLSPEYPTGATEQLRDAIDGILSQIGAVPGSTLADIFVGPSSARAVAPAGGITCGEPDDNPLEVQKVNSGPAVPGSSFDYTIAVGNVGDCPMSPVRVVDTLVGPPGTTIALTEPAGATVTDQGGGTFQISWADVGPIPADGRTTLRIRVNVPDSAAVGFRYSDVVSSTAQVTSEGGCTPREVTNQDTLNEPVVVRGPSGPCSTNGSTKAASHEQVYPGESFVYFVNVINSGGQPCTNVTVVDPIDSRLTFESCSDGCTFSAPNATWNIGTLNPGQSVTLRLQVKVNQGATGTLANIAVIDSDQSDPTTVRTTGPNITTNSVLRANEPATIPDRTLARTGGAALPWPVAMGLLALALGAWQLTRRSDELPAT